MLGLDSLFDLLQLAIKERTRAKSFITEVIEHTASQPRPSWLEFDPAKVSGKLITAPERTDLPFELSENAIIEFYSQKL